MTLGLQPDLRHPRRDGELTMAAWNGAEACAGGPADAGFVAPVEHIDQLAAYALALPDGSQDYSLRVDSRFHEVAHLWVGEGPPALVEARVELLALCAMERVGRIAVAVEEPSLEGMVPLREWDGTGRAGFEAALRLGSWLQAKAPLQVLLGRDWSSWKAYDQDPLTLSHEDPTTLAGGHQRRALEQLTPSRRWDQSLWEGPHLMVPNDRHWHCTPFSTSEGWMRWPEGDQVPVEVEGSAIRVDLPASTGVVLYPTTWEEGGSCIEGERGVLTATPEWASLLPGLSLPENPERAFIALGGEVLELSAHSARFSDGWLAENPVEVLQARIDVVGSGDRDARMARWPLIE